MLTEKKIKKVVKPVAAKKKAAPAKPPVKKAVAKTTLSKEELKDAMGNIHRKLVQAKKDDNQDAIRILNNELNAVLKKLKSL
tara:strand:+ start:1246 stop:1491 length:246 start_codon:yes stop_codon:yes gene_type:complete